LILKLINVALVIIYATGSGLWVSTGDAWYRSLNAPSWQPPDWVFGVIWPYNFIVLGIVGWQVFSNLGNSWGKVWLSIFAVTIIFALMWANLFYVKHNIGAASISLSLVAFFTIPLLALAFKTNYKYGLLLTPYQIWVTIASFLSFSYFKLNK
jgi:tryptophan-rich sensory protein